MTHPADAAMGAVHAERMRRFIRAGLYLVTSQPLSAGRSTPAVVEAALRGGVRLVQVREKELPLRALLALTRELRTLTRAYGALLIVNDRLDIALAAGADGVHLGQSDLPIADARRIAPDLIIGASSHSAAQAAAAGREGASYVNIGPLFPTQTKDWTGEFLGMEGLRRIAPAVDIPFTVMGGI
jgi:thiamine-phosphate pyrophosphorylase